MPFVSITKLKIFYSENTMQGIPVLFIHGWLGSSNEWIYQIFFFNSKRHIIILDLPGFGKSDKPNTKYSIEFFSNQILEFLDVIGYNEVILVGHSLGGMIALNIAIKNKDLVKKLILISTSASFTPSNKDKIILFMVNLIFKINYKKFLKSIIHQIISNTSENTEFKKLYLNALKIPKSIVLSTFKNMTSKYHLSNKNLVSQPTLIIYGNKDKIITKSMLNNLKDLIPNSEMVVINNGTHRVMFNNHKEINELIKKFIEK